MNEVWFSNLSDPEEFPKVQIVPDYTLRHNEVYLLDFDVWKHRGSSVASIAEIQKNINKWYNNVIVTGKLECVDPGMNAVVQLNACDHKWKHYQGFSETYEYCEACDEKRT